VQEYPRAGDPNAPWWLHVIDVASGQDIQIPVANEYLVRVNWAPDGSLYVQTANRPQTSVQMHRWHAGQLELVLEEKDDAWVRFHRDLRFLKKGGILWSSERSGRKHLYVAEKGKLRAITSGDWSVASVVALDADKVFFTASKQNPWERRLYVVGLDGRNLRAITPEAGWHGVSASKDARWFVDSYSRVGQPPRVVLRDAEGKIVRELAQGKPVEGIVRPEFVKIPAADGTELQGMLYRAKRESPGPAIVHVYAGPGSHMVVDRWGGASHFWHQRMIQRGYSILKVDGRGTGGYGRAFTRIVKGRLCDWEVRDQTAGARWLAKQPEVDPKRIGVWGWSYGGTMALMCLQEAGDVFAAGVSVAPVTDWRDYDTAYTERYLGLPKDNIEGYKLSSPLSGAHKLRRPLLLAHGMADDNVHWINAIAYVDKVQKAGQLIEMDFYPRGKHGIGGKKEKKLLFRRMERFWDRELGN
ncbi:MAG: S9 family peptidase, partial [Planctomycetota bacterium]|jgi:dipeptidyl-peptidase-4